MGTLARITLVTLALLAAPLAPSAFAQMPNATQGAAASAAASAASVAAQLVAAFDRVFKGPYPGERAIHAKGIVLRGTFAADAAAATLTTAEHVQPDRGPVPVIVRFSDFSGMPAQGDGKPGATPSGMAIKFQLPEDVDTDIVAHSFNGFPVGTAEAFFEYLNALTTSDPAVRAAFFTGHPAAKQFVDAPKPVPVSYATDGYYGVDAFRFINAAAVGRFGRYRIEPVAGAHYLDTAQTAALKPDYLRDELPQRLASGPVAFRLFVQLAEPGDVVTDPTVAWPADRPQVLLGTLSLTAIVPPADPVTRTLFFSPMNLVPGIAASDDPLLAARTRSYAISYRRRLAKE